MSVEVQASGFGDPTSGVDWEDLYPGVWTERDEVTGEAITEDEELFGDAWLEARAWLTDEELDRWLGAQGLGPRRRSLRGLLVRPFPHLLLVLRRRCRDVSQVAAG